MRLKKLITLICQYAVGFLFIFSGLIKANDPRGFGIKLEEYFHVFKQDFGMDKLMDLMAASADTIGIILLVVEMVLGVALIVGSWRKFTRWALLVLIVFFTFLTFYSAYFDKVTDCGCFGDAIKLTPWGSFTKDIILLALILVIFVNHNHLQSMFRSRTAGRRIVVLSGVVFLLFTLYTYRYLPIVDFRPYKPGNDIYELSKMPDDAPRDSFNIQFIYKKKAPDSTERVFTMAEIMEADTAVMNQYKFARREQKLIRKGYAPPVNDFSLTGEDGENYTDSFFNQKGYRLVVVYYNMERTDWSRQAELNQLHKDLKGKVPFWGLTGSSFYLANAKIAEEKIPYRFFSMDATPLKTMIRSNPGLMLFRDNTVVKYWPGSSLPSAESVQGLTGKSE